MLLTKTASRESHIGKGDRMKIHSIRVVLAAALFAVSALAQGKRPSPPEQTAIRLDGHEVTIKYSAPYAKGREIWGGLVPYGQVWRLGANEATSLSTDADLKIGDLNVPKGNYTLYMLPGASESLLIVNKQTGQWGTEYSEGQDLGRVKLTKAPASPGVEQLAIQLKPAGSGSATLSIRWEKAEFSVPVTLGN